MPRVVKGERPGMVFNVSYGIQGQARYTHVPSILEMMGIPYVASGPLAHSLALDKVVTKVILVQQGLPTPEFAVLEIDRAQHVRGYGLGASGTLPNIRNSTDACAVDAGCRFREMLA